MYEPNRNFYPLRGKTPGGRGTPFRPERATARGGTYYPKRPLHSFQDLEVYQKTLECSVLVGRRINSPAVPLPKLRSVEAKSQK